MSAKTRCHKRKRCQGTVKCQVPVYFCFSSFSRFNPLLLDYRSLVVHIFYIFFYTRPRLSQKFSDSNGNQAVFFSFSVFHCSFNWAQLLEPSFCAVIQNLELLLLVSASWNGEHTTWFPPNNKDHTPPIMKQILKKNQTCFTAFFYFSIQLVYQPLFISFFLESK